MKSHFTYYFDPLLFYTEWLKYTSVSPRILFITILSRRRCVRLNSLIHPFMLSVSLLHLQINASSLCLTDDYRVLMKMQLHFPSGECAAGGISLRWRGIPGVHLLLSYKSFVIQDSITLGPSCFSEVRALSNVLSL